MFEGIAILTSAGLAFVSFLALIIGLRRKERGGVRRVLLLVVVCASIAPCCWLIASALHARDFGHMYTGTQRKLLATRGLADRFDRDSLVGGAAYAWFPALAAALLALRIRSLPAQPKTE